MKTRYHKSMIKINENLEKMSRASFLIIFLSPLLFILIPSSLGNAEEKREYVVYMGGVSKLVMPLTQHTSILQEVTGQSSIEDRFLRSYGRSFSGFSALLTESERQRVASMDGVVSVFPVGKHKLHTTMSWDFMGLKEGKRSNRNPATESDTIIGVIDSGIWPESKSFSDKGFSIPPPKWKGACEGGRNFTCNNKLIGARYYTTESARDDVGHGSHTASTAAGNAVSAVTFYGLGNGTARGGVPGARVAAYKACDIQGCRSDSILSAFDDAIADHVDLITISIGVGVPFERNPIAIGAFHAMAKGILTVNSAGNYGPTPSTVSSLAPWIFTVAASNTNRAFVTKVVLGNGKTVDGRSVNSFDHNGTMYPLVYGGSASTKCADDLARFCTPGCLDSKLVKGKIVLCDSAEYTEEVQSKGAVGSIVTSSTLTDVSYMFSLPVSVLLNEDYKTVLAYMKATKRPKAAVLKSQTIFTQIAPVVAGFSSRGPNLLFPDILKPDITAPGVEILAAYSPEASLTDSLSDRRRVKYAVESGTSMSCPHVAGASAYIKTFHPEWSPSMIQSAIMTTAWPMSMDQGEFAYGAGHVDPIKAVDPGLVYEVDKSDHINFLCGMNYTLKMLQLISGEAVTCTGKTLPKNLNYPSMTARVAAGKQFQVNFSRTLRNVGMRSTYKAEVSGSKLEVRVIPEALSLNTIHEKQSFELTVSGSGPEEGKMLSAQLMWSDGVHAVRSPIVIYA